MAGLHPVEFAGWAQSTSQVLLSGKDAFINAAQKNNYGIISRMWRGTDMSRILRGGQYIEEQILTSVRRRSQTYLPSEPLNYVQSDPGTQLIYGWRFHMHHLAWQEELLVLQGTGDMTEGARMEVWKKYLKKLHAEFWTEVSDYYEELLMSKPSADSEGITGRSSGSIPMFVNEYTNGLFSDSSVTMTTVGLKSPATVDNWRVQKFPYSNFTVANGANWIKAMRKAKRLIGFKASPIHAEHGTAVNMNATDTVILASEWGARSVEDLYLNSQDRWQNQSDPFGAVYFDGIPLQYIAYKDSAAIYPGNATPTSAAATTEQLAAVTGPRFEVINTTHLYLCMHKDRVLKDLGVQNDSRTPTTKAQPYNTFAQLVCDNLRANASIYPDTNVTYT